MNQRVSPQQDFMGKVPEPGPSLIWHELKRLMGLHCGVLKATHYGN